MSTSAPLNGNPSVPNATSPAKLGVLQVAKDVLRPLSSLKLTVVLLALAVFNVLVGTLAQVEHDIWKAVNDYFRIDMHALSLDEFPWINFKQLFCWVPLGLFTPESFIPEGYRLSMHKGFWFPRGWTIGAVMLVNLLAAHSVRFTMRARGARLFWGIGTLLGGILITWGVIQSGSSDSFQSVQWVSYANVWKGMGLLQFIACAACVYGVIESRKSHHRMVLAAIALVMAAGSLAVFNASIPSDASMRILHQLATATSAALVTLVGCWLVFDKRAGIVLLHGGVGLMMVYEVFIGMHAGTMETRMQIEEGETVNYAFDIRYAELAVVDTSSPDNDQHTVIPQHLLVEGQKISDPSLPVDLEIVKFLVNSELLNPDAPIHQQAIKETPNPATKGLGLERVARAARAATGTEMDSKVDVPSVYVRVLEKSTGKDLGVYLATAALVNFSDPFTVDNKKYSLSLRYRRDYKPYTVQLHDVQRNLYVGTESPKDFRSIITIKDRSGQEVVKNHPVWMNNPLRFGGESFYQSNFIPADRQQGEMTDLQVVANEGWMTPYVACMLTVVGMAFQFSLALMRFLEKLSRSKPQDTGEQRKATSRSNRWVEFGVPAAVVVLGAMTIAEFARNRNKPGDGPDLQAFAKLPIFYNGRAQPIDTLARNTMLQLVDKQTFKNPTAEDPKKFKTQPAMLWLLDVITRSPNANKHRVFRIDNPDLVKSLGLEWRDGLTYSLSEFEEKWKDQLDSLDVVEKKIKDKLPLSALENKLVVLAQKIQLMKKMEVSFVDPASMPEFEIPSLPNPQMLADPATSEAAMQQVFAVREYLQLVEERVGDMKLPLVVPVHLTDEEGASDKSKKKSLTSALDARWETFMIGALMAKYEQDMGQPGPQGITLWQEILAAYKSQDNAKFNAKVIEYRQLLDKASLEDLTVEGTGGGQMSLWHTDFETFFNRFAPFNAASWIYLAVSVLVLIGWLSGGTDIGWMRPLLRSSYWLMLLNFALHTWAIWGRIEISGRPPVTNLYGASVFIGWGCVLLAAALELTSRQGFGTAVASIAGFLTLRIAHSLAGDGDTFEVLQAVLDTQFWLATHVVCISLGYATTYVSGLLGIMMILGGLFTPALNEERRRQLYTMNYGALTFALLFSFFGTVLGGLWADDSWGRFWGWDPKENGALIIVLWNALVLHALWDRQTGERGMAVLTVLGNIVVSWSFFGVNELGVGLHSYGKSEGKLQYLGWFCLAHLIIAALGCLPKGMWLSYRRLGPKSTTVQS